MEKLIDSSEREDIDEIFHNNQSFSNTNENSSFIPELHQTPARRSLSISEHCFSPSSSHLFPIGFTDKNRSISLHLPNENEHSWFQDNFFSDSNQNFLSQTSDLEKNSQSSFHQNFIESKMSKLNLNSDLLSGSSLFDQNKSPLPDRVHSDSSFMFSTDISNQSFLSHYGQEHLDSFLFSATQDNSRQDEIEFPRKQPVEQPDRQVKNAADWKANDSIPSSFAFTAPFESFFLNPTYSNSDSFGFKPKEPIISPQIIEPRFNNQYEHTFDKQPEVDQINDKKEVKTQKDYRPNSITAEAAPSYQQKSKHVNHSQNREPQNQNKQKQRSAKQLNHLPYVNPRHLPTFPVQSPSIYSPFVTPPPLNIPSHHPIHFQSQHPSLNPNFFSPYYTNHFSNPGNHFVSTMNADLHLYAPSSPNSDMHHSFNQIGHIPTESFKLENSNKQLKNVDSKENRRNKKKKPNSEMLSLYGAMCTNLDQFAGTFYEMSKDQLGCRLIQRKIDEEGKDAATLVLSEVCDYLSEMMIDPFGNYLFQKILETISPDQRTEVTELTKDYLIDAAINLHGTRSVQKIVELCNTSAQRNIIVGALQSSTVKLCLDSNGNHVIQRALQHMPDEYNHFIFDAVAKSCYEICTHRHGCCVVQRCLDAASPQQKKILISEINKFALSLMQDPYGNYVIQYVLDTCSLDESYFVIKATLGSVQQLSIQKFSSNVIEKCIEKASGDLLTSLINELASPENIKNLIQDQFANYVIQRALSTSCTPQCTKLVEVLRPHLANMKQSSGGRRIASKIFKLFPDLDISPQIDNTKESNIEFQTNRTSSPTTLTSASLQSSSSLSSLSSVSSTKAGKSKSKTGNITISESTQSSSNITTTFQN